MATIYLAGGFKSRWQDSVVTHHLLIDPSKKDETNMSMKEIGEWDKNEIRNCNILFAYMERENMSGFGLSCELGYAHALGKTIILVLEKNHKRHDDKSLEFLTCFADYVFDDFSSGLFCLNELPQGT